MNLPMSIINIKSEEKKPAVLLFLMFFAIVSAGIIGTTCRDTIFLTQFDRSYLPLMFVAIAVFMAGFITLYKYIIAGHDQILIISLSGLFFTLSLVFFQANLSGLFIPALYIWIEAITIISIFQFWVLTGEIFNARQAKRIFSLISAGGSFAAIGSGIIIKPFINVFGPNKLLFLTIFFIGLYVIIAQLLHPYRKILLSDQNIISNNKPRSLSKFDSYIKSIAILIGLSAFISKTVDYQFKMVAASAFPNSNDLVSFFGSYYMFTGTATLIMQFFVTGFILTRFGILPGLLILPLTLALGSVGFFIFGTISAVFIAKFSDQVFKFSTNNSIQEILWVPIAKEKKKKIKPVIDGTIRASFEGMAGIIIFTLVTFKLITPERIHWLSIFIILGLIIWIWNSFRIHDGYVQALLKAIENRQLNLDEIEYDINDANTIDTIDKTLQDEDELKQLFALDLLWELQLDPWKKTLQNLFSHGSQPVRRAVLELAWKQSEIISDNYLVNIINKKSDLKPFIIACAGDRMIKDIHLEVDLFLNSGDSATAASAAVAILRQNPNHLESKLLLENLLNSNEEGALCTTISFLRNAGEWISIENTQRFLTHPYSDNVKNEMLSVLINYPNQEFLDLIIQNLSSAATYDYALKALLQFDSSLIAKRLHQFLFNESSSFELQLGILKASYHFSNNEMLKAIITKLESEDLRILNGICDALIKLSKNIMINDSSFITINNHISKISKRAYQLYQIMEYLQTDKHAYLLLDQIRNDLENIIPIILKLGTLDKSEIPIETYIRYVQSQDPELLPIVLELIESTFTNNNCKMTLPLIDPDSDKEIIGMKLFPDLIQDPAEFLSIWIENLQPWKSAIAIQYLIKSENTSVLKKINWSELPNSLFETNIFNQIEQDHLNRNYLNKNLSITGGTPMYSILEKTIILKSVDLFKNIPGDILTYIAQISEEVNYEDGEEIFRQGDYGDSLFVIIFGEVDVIQGGHSITKLGKGDCIGEMALLDQEPRSADAYTTQETLLLKIHQEGFYQLMASNSEIMKQIVKLLSHRLRKVNTKLTDAQ